MAGLTKTRCGVRHGKHAPDAFSVSICLSVEDKAMAISTAERRRGASQKRA